MILRESRGAIGVIAGMTTGKSSTGIDLYFYCCFVILSSTKYLDSTSCIYFSNLISNTQSSIQAVSSINIQRDYFIHTFVLKSYTNMLFFSIISSAPFHQLHLVINYLDGKIMGGKRMYGSKMAIKMMAMNPRKSPHHIHHSVQVRPETKTTTAGCR